MNIFLAFLRWQIDKLVWDFFFLLVKQILTDMLQGLAKHDYKGKELYRFVSFCSMIATLWRSQQKGEASEKEKNPVRGPCVVGVSRSVGPGGESSAWHSQYCLWPGNNSL